MADDRDDADRTEEPTQRRLDDARSHGDIVKSQEVSTVAVLAGGVIAIAIFGHSAAVDLALLMSNFLEKPDEIGVGSADLMVLLREVLLKLGGILLAPFALMMATAFAGHVGQSGFSFTPERLSLDLTKLSPLAGLKRMFGIDGLTTLVKGLIKMAMVGIVLWMELWPERTRLEAMLGQSPMAIASDMMELLFKIAIATLLVLGVIAGFDFFIARMRFMSRNRMSKQEIKEEFRQTEGDPVVKARVRQLRQERAKRRMIAAVKRATVVITNPTHFAVALTYESGKMDAPMCVAKGVDLLALRIREEAEKNGVPVVENPPLARALYATVELDEEIPAEHYKAVAKVIGYVMGLTGQKPEAAE
jgi:flagellar biosynthetic protein FlhB